MQYYKWSQVCLKSVSCTLCWRNMKCTKFSLKQHCFLYLATLKILYFTCLENSAHASELCNEKAADTVKTGENETEDDESSSKQSADISLSKLSSPEVTYSSLKSAVRERTTTHETGDQQDAHRWICDLLWSIQKYKFLILIEFHFLYFLSTCYTTVLHFIWFGIMIFYNAVF